MIKILDNNPIDCILLDYNMGVESGLSIGELIKTKYSDPPPIVMLTGEAKERTIVKAFRGGFSDFVSKQNLDLDDLFGAISSAVDRKLIDRAEKKERDRLASASRFDSTIGLHTAGFMKERMEDLAASARRRGGRYGAIIIRLPALNSIGDALGYVMRDRALRAFASRLQTATREDDICGRYIEDSFLYLIDRQASLSTVSKFCERLSRGLSFEAKFEKASFTFAPNIGAALFPLDGTSVEQLLAAAEIALAHARLSGAPFATASSLPVEASGCDPSISASEDAVANEAATGESSRLIVNRHTDRRSERRRRVLKRGKILVHGIEPGEILVPGIEPVIDCMVRDISNNGARLRVDECYAPPDAFVLLIADSGDRRSAKVRWRVRNEIGVQFFASARA
jgi:diguanylate cyclase (GGDEF)-like protein